MQLKCSQVQKRSKYIGKTVHVTSVAQFQFCDTARILFLHKENKNNNLLNHSSPPSYVVRHFREYHNAYYARFPLSVNNDTQIMFMCALSPRTSSAILESTQERIWRTQRCLRNSGEKNGWVNCYFCFLCAKKKYSRSVAKLKLSHWCHMDCFTDVFTTFLDLGTFARTFRVAVYGGSDSSPISSKTS